MNNQNIHQINSDIEKAINIAKLIKDKYNQRKDLRLFRTSSLRS